MFPNREPLTNARQEQAQQEEHPGSHLCTQKQRNDDADYFMKDVCWGEYCYRCSRTLIRNNADLVQRLTGYKRKTKRGGANVGTRRKQVSYKNSSPQHDHPPYPPRMRSTDFAPPSPGQRSSLRRRDSGRETQARRARLHINSRECTKDLQSSCPSPSSHSPAMHIYTNYA